LRREKHEVLVYDDVVLFVASKPATAIASQRERKLLVRRRIRPGSVLIRYFRNVASTDLKALFPNVRVVMGVRDTLALGVPAIAGAIPILINLASTATVLFLVIGFYLGIMRSPSSPGSISSTLTAGGSGFPRPRTRWRACAGPGPVC